MPDQLRYHDDTSFDFIKWKKCSNHVLTYKTMELLTDAEVQGELELRQGIAKYVYQSKGVYCKAEDIVVGAGAADNDNAVRPPQEARERIHKLRNPGFMLSRNIFRDYSYDVTSIDIEENGINIDALREIDPDIVYISPSHQFPTGAVMPVAKRMQVLNWAMENEKYIIEDDYDSELRYTGKPVPALKGLDKNDRVIYAGSFSSTSAVHKDKLYGDAGADKGSLYQHEGQLRSGLLKGGPADAQQIHEGRPLSEAYQADKKNICGKEHP